MSRLVVTAEKEKNNDSIVECAIDKTYPTYRINNEITEHLWKGDKRKLLIDTTRSTFEEVRLCIIAKANLV